MQFCVRRRRWKVVPFWSVIIAGGVFALARGYPEDTSILTGSVILVVGVVCLLNHAIYSRCCITDSFLSYRDWFGLVQHDIPLSQISKLENVRKAGGYVPTYFLTIRWGSDSVGLNRNLYKEGDLARIVRLIRQHNPSVRIQPGVLQRWASASDDATTADTAHE